MASGVESTPGSFRTHRGQERAELGAFLLLIVPSLSLSLLVRQEQDIGFAIAAVAIMLRDIALVALILYFLRRNGEPLTAIGWRRRGAAREAVIGLALSIPTLIGEVLLNLALSSFGLSSPSKPPSDLSPHGLGQLVLAALLVVVVAVAEETIFRGYLLLRLRDIGAGTPLAIVFSSAVFALGHGYEGSAGLVAVGILGVVLAIVYTWRGSLVAPMVMHFVLDLVPIVLLPLYAARS